MPIYEYFCSKCHREFEEIVFGDELPSCAHCGASQCQKLMSRPCVQRAGCNGGGNGGDGMAAPSSGTSKCGGCSGGNCATCH